MQHGALLTQREGGGSIPKEKLRKYEARCSAVTRLARNLGKDEDEVVRHLCQRLGVLIVRGNAAMMASRHPTFAPPEVDGDPD